jgi:hypothetical protein
MSLNALGLVTAAATFFAIWFGHVGVRKVEAACADLRWPALAALALGLLCEVGAALSPSRYASAALGIAGMTLLWDALEFRRQHHRVARGHAPANPANPRHARLLAHHQLARARAGGSPRQRRGGPVAAGAPRAGPCGSSPGRCLMSLFGLGLGLATLFIIGLGFVWVIRGEYFFGYLWWPYVMGLGFALIAASLFVPGAWGSALLGAFGASLIWGATELKEQAVRAEIGWYPFNPKAKPQPPFVERIKTWPAPHL